MKALIFCAGLGTRLRPLTNDIPKPMVKVAGKPVLEHLVEHLNSFGISEIIINLHYKPEKFYKYFGTRLLYFYEPKLLGESKTELYLSPWLGKRYVIMNGDTLTDININTILTISEKYNSSVLSYVSEETVYTGTAVKVINGDLPIKGNFSCYWQDIGTPKGLKKAREYYET